MNIASIDMGSNTVLLLIAEVNSSTGEIIPIVNKYKMPRLGRGLKNGSRILDESIYKLFNILDEYKKLTEENNCKKVIIKATNAMRIASNSEDIITRVKEKYDWEVDVIPGEEEARLSFLGAASALPESNEKVVIDIGGGSTEIIYGKNKELLFRKSFPVGVVSLTEKYLKSDPPSSEEINEAENHLSEIFSEMLGIIPQELPSIAVAGTPTTLSAIKHGLKKYIEEEIEGSVLSSEDLQTLLKDLTRRTSKNIKEVFGDIVEGREDVITAGTLMLRNFTKTMKLDKLIVSGKGIRYGAIIDYINGISGK